MKISLQELRSLEDFVQRLEDERDKKYVTKDGDPAPWSYYAEHPHFLMLMGFDEYVAFKNRKAFRHLWFADDVEDTGQSIYRKPSGKWHLLWVAPNDRNDNFLFKDKRTLPEDDEHSLRIPLQKIFKKIYQVAGKAVPEEKTIWSPRLWTPSSQERERVCLQGNIKQVLFALKTEKIRLASVSWRQLEEIVAEVLRSQGMEIYLVKDKPQGGRDILARGELIPGQEPMTMAVEVKHRRIVDRAEVQKALWQNRQFPALLFVTSGRFTAGVLKEKALPENQLRLFLKDGEALGDLLRDYKLGGT